MQQIFSVVKKTREENLCGLGSQSYGSLLRKKIADACEPNEVIDFIGAGQLVEEIVPWLQKKWNYRIWCRDADKIKNKEYAQAATKILNINQPALAAKHLVVAAPLTHDELSQWIRQRKSDSGLSVYDFRSDSMSYADKNSLISYFHLNHFTDEVAQQAEQIQTHIKDANYSIALWKMQAEKRAHVRPFGWDDL